MRLFQIPTKEQVIDVLQSDEPIEDRVWRITWTNGQQSTLIGATVYNALEVNGYNPEGVMKYIKTWDLVK